jgi:hypothetical protein
VHQREAHMRHRLNQSRRDLDMAAAVKRTYRHAIHDKADATRHTKAFRKALRKQKIKFRPAAKGMRNNGVIPATFAVGCQYWYYNPLVKKLRVGTLLKYRVNAKNRTYLDIMCLFKNSRGGSHVSVPIGLISIAQ